MKKLNIEIKKYRQPKLDKEFIPIGLFNKSFLASAGRDCPIGIAVEAADGQIEVFNTFIHGTEDKFDADCYYIERVAKTMLWMKGGFRIYVSGKVEDSSNKDCVNIEGETNNVDIAHNIETVKRIYEYLKRVYSPEGERAFDYEFMGTTYNEIFEVVFVENLPEKKDNRKKLGGHTDGCRIGFDAGGSDRKVSAVIDGESVFSEETVWHPKTTEDPSYHYEGITAALRAAAAHLPKVDAVGVSTAGIVINNRIMQASLFNKVPRDLWKDHVNDIYINAVKDVFGDIPVEVANDGDISAVAGVMSIGEPGVLGIAMGTSEAAGFVDGDGCITGWLNELAFVPVDCAETAMEDEWSGDIGCGVKYFSQDGIIKLAPRSGIELAEDLTPAEKLKVVQGLMEEGDERAKEVYESIGVYLGHTLPFYYDLYGMKHVLLLGRVMSGKGGDLILKTAKEVLTEEYTDLASKINVQLPDEKFRRVGQSAAAAGLPEIRK